MAGNLLNIGKTGLFAAQAGLATTGHNIANAHVPGYSREVVLQSTTLAQDYGYGFVGNGTQVVDIKRYSDEFLNTQVRAAQAASSALGMYSAQINQVDNLLSDPNSGLSPALQDFFKSVQDVAADPSTVPSRQALLSSGEALAARFQALNGRMEEIRDGINSQIISNVNLINSYAQQIAKLNDQISIAGNATGNAPNDLMDSRDQLVIELNKQVKATVVKGDNNTISVSIGSGQPLVSGQRAYQLAVTASATDPTRLEVGFVIGAKAMPLPASALTGGELGGMLDFRTNTLDKAENALGRIAITMAATINAQHRLGIDSAGNLGGDMFKPSTVLINSNSNNLYTGPNPVGAVITNVRQLTTSDYSVTFDGANYSVTRLSDNQKTPIVPYPQLVPQTIDGIDFTMTVDAVAGDSFLVRPTVNGAAQMSMAITDVGKVAAAAPVAASVPGSNKGSAKITDGVVDATYLNTGNPLGPTVTLSYASATGALIGFPVTQDVTVTTAAGSTVYLAGTVSIPYTAGATYSFGGISVTMSGQPADTDTFVIEKNTGASRDNRNMALIGALQAKPILDNGSATYQSSYAQLVGSVGNKAREVQVNAKASESLLTAAGTAQQNVSGVNLDEEAANLVKYQQAYQASGKVMQIASTLFDTLLQLGN